MPTVQRKDRVYPYFLSRMPVISATRSPCLPEYSFSAGPAWSSAPAQDRTVISPVLASKSAVIHDADAVNTDADARDCSAIGCPSAAACGTDLAGVKRVPVYS